MADIIVREAPAPVWHVGNDGPRLEQRIKPRKGYGLNLSVDPMPGYSADLALVAEMVERAAAVFPISRPIDVFTLRYETLDRYNAQTARVFDYYGDRPEGEAASWQGLIIVHGKRIPPHPAMVRYLSGHEYGHLVAYAIADRMTAAPRDGSEHQNLYPLYARLRGLEDRDDDGAWHASTAEVFACDFRILVAGIESDFWPHPGVPHPNDVPGLAAWWEQMRAGATPIADEAPHADQMVAERSRTADAGDPNPERGSVG